MIAFLAAIVFGAPGPEQRIAFHDATVRAEIRYRLAAQPAYRGELAVETDTGLLAGEAAMLVRCRGLARDVRSGSRTEAEAAALFSKHDCSPG